MAGWIKLHRKILDNDVLKENKPYSRLEAWIYLLLEVNHADGKTLIDGSMVEVKRGSTITSIRKLCDRWKWSNTKTCKFLKVLEKEQMLMQKSDTKKTVLTLMNYDIHQSEKTQKATQKRHENDTETTQKHTNKNVKNDKNEKKKDLYLDFVLLTMEEYQKLNNTLGTQKTAEMIERLNSYGHQKEKKFKEYTSHYHTILSWIRKDNDNPKGKPKIPRGFQSIMDYVGSDKTD